MYNSRKEVPDDTYSGNIRDDQVVRPGRPGRPRCSGAAWAGHGRRASGPGAAPGRRSGPDGAVSGSGWMRQLLIDTHDGLVQFLRVGGAPGTKLVPDLATALPTPTDGGKTYLFHIRRGIKFSNGQVMKPSDFVTTFERQFTVPGPTSFYSCIVGADKCNTKGCDLSQGVVADDSAYTLTINLTAPDPEFLDKLALPFAYVVPASTSKKLTGNNVPPGTGPYMWQSYNPNSELV